jgi:hypothetical protein
MFAFEFLETAQMICCLHADAQTDLIDRTKQVRERDAKLEESERGYQHVAGCLENAQDSLKTDTAAFAQAKADWAKREASLQKKANVRSNHVGLANFVSLV